MNIKHLVTRTTIIFVILALSDFIVVTGAQVPQNTSVQTLMIAIGAAIFGSGLTFFPLRIAMLYEK